MSLYALASAAVAVLISRAVPAHQTSAVPLYFATVPLFYWRAIVLWFAVFLLALHLDARAEKHRRGRRTLRGTRLVSPESFNRVICGDGLGPGAPRFPARSSGA